MVFVGARLAEALHKRFGHLQRESVLSSYSETEW